MKTIYNKASNKSGVYKIINTTNGRIYIGSAKCFKVRCNQYIQKLNKGTCHNKFLQNEFNKCGEDAFEFHVIEVVPGEQSKRLLAEQKHIDKFYDNQEQCYNFDKKTSKNGRSCFSKTPEQTSALISENMKRVWKDPAHKKRIAQKAKERWQDLAYKEKCIKNLTGPTKQGRQKCNEALKQKWKEPGYKERLSKKISETLKNKMKNDPEFQEQTLQNLDRTGTAKQQV